MSPYIISFLSLLLTCGIQYALSFGLIQWGYYSNNYYPLGGFIVWIALFLVCNSSLQAVYDALVGEEGEKISIAVQNERTTVGRVLVVFTIAATFYQNLRLAEVYEKYEYLHYGVQSRAKIVHKYITKTQKGGNIPYVVFKYKKDGISYNRTMMTTLETYEKARIDDSVSIEYSTRNQGFTRIIAK